MQEAPRPLTGFLAAALVLALAGCQLATRSAKPPPLEGEAEVWVYLQPLPAQAERLAIEVASASAARGEGGDVPLKVAAARVTGQEERRQRLLAAGRLPPGSYTGLRLQVAKATLSSESGKSDLLLPAEPTLVNVAFTASRGRVVVVRLSLQADKALAKEFGFTPTFEGSVPGRPLPELTGVCSATGSDALVVFDKHAREVAAVIPTGRDPRGLALGPRGDRAYVALTGDDQVQAVDLPSGAALASLRLQPGDQPREVGITPDGRLMVVVNTGSNTASFADPGALVELNRVNTGIQPQALLLDRSNRRGYVFNRLSRSITVLDLATRSVAGTIATDPEPLRGALNRAGTRLYVIHAGSPYLLTVSLPDLQTVSRTFVGLGASGVKVDPRTDFVYVAMGVEGRLQVFDPLSFLPGYFVEVPGAVTTMTVDDAYNLLFAVVPEQGSLAAVELVSRRPLPAMDVGSDPYQAAVAGERP